jgi:DNA replication and repair protein RecF
MPHITALTLTNFRNYDSATVSGLDNGFIILIGDNGAGKTNCLEAISFLAPGRGLRGSSVSECRTNNAKSPWVVSAQIKHDDGELSRLGVGQDPQKTEKKIIRLDGTPIKSQTELGDVFRAIWLTPQMDGLFLQGASERRRFFDRLVATFDPSHSGRLTRYEKATRERINILKTAQDQKSTPDHIWLTGLEAIMAETGIALAAARIDLLEKIHDVIATTAIESFPHTRITLDGEVETALQSQSALSVEDHFKQKLRDNRQGDAITGRTLYGTHRTDMQATYQDKNQRAAQCSTGEQKAMLTTIIMAHAILVKNRFGFPPVLLFDEVCAHFDEHRRDALFDILGNLGGQIWMSGQDKKSFRSILSNRLISITKNQMEKM